MNILLVGGGAREHAMAKALFRSSSHPLIYCCAPTLNPGIESLATDYWTGDIIDANAILNQAKAWKIDFAIIGPEAPLESGIADALQKKGIAVIGPTKSLARIETSKIFTRDLLTKHHVAGSPQYKFFSELAGVKDFLKLLGNGNYVIKADGLMGGKGVKVAGDHLHSLDEAYQFCESLIAASHAFLIEEKCIGQEFSLMCFCDGKNLIPMPLVQDHKRAYVNDEGPNTGGMGSYSDANHRLPFVSVDDVVAAMKINHEAVHALMKECGEKYKGILYGSFMATKYGVRLIEYNARFGDPEVMNVLAILETDFVAICQAILDGTLEKMDVRFSLLATVCKYVVPEGYPDHACMNACLDVSDVENKAQLYYAGVEMRDEKLVATGSRAVAIVGVANTIAAAEKMAEADVLRIHGNVFHRSDIGTEELIQRRVTQMQELRRCII